MTITGVVNDSLESVISLTVQGPSGETRSINAVIDTGFGGFLTLPPLLIADLNLPFVGLGRATLGDGSEVAFPFYDVAVLWDGGVQLGLADTADTTPLVGMAMLENYDLHLEVRHGGRVTIEQLP